MTVLVADVQGADALAVIELHPEGAYLLLFDRTDLSRPTRDILQDDISIAKSVAASDFGIPEHSWVEDARRSKIM